MPDPEQGDGLLPHMATWQRSSGLGIQRHILQKMDSLLQGVAS